MLNRHMAATAAALALALCAAAWGQRWEPGMETPGFQITELDAHDAVYPGQFFVDPPTVHSFGFRWYIQGDANRRSKVEVAYRQKGADEWREGLPMLRVHHEVVDQARGGWRCGNLFAGSVMFLDPATEYEVRFAMSHPEGAGPPTDVVDASAGASPTGVVHSMTGDGVVITVSTRSEPNRYAGERTVPVVPAGHEGPPPRGALELAEALAQARPGDVLLLQPGVHRGTFEIGVSGEPGRPLVLRGEEGAVVEGPSPERGTSLFDVSNASHIRFEDLTLRNAGIVVHGGNRRGPGGHWIVVRNCRIEEVWSGIWIFSEHAENWHIADNVIVGRNPSWYPRTEEGRGYLEPSHTGINIYGRGHVVAYNRIGGFGDSLAVANYRTPEADLLTHCLNLDFYHNHLSDAYDDIIETDYAFHNVRVWRNLGYNAHTGLSVQPSYGGPIYFIRNEMYAISGLSYKLHNYCTGTVAYHNTTVSAGYGFRSMQRWLHGTLRNNLIMGASGYAIATGSITDYTTLDYNGYTRNDPERFIRWFDGRTRREFASLQEFAEGAGHERHGVMVDYGIFVNAEPPQRGETAEFNQWDLRLRPGTAATDAGVRLPNVNDNFTGTAPDLGAHERGQPLPHYGPRVGNRR